MSIKDMANSIKEQFPIFKNNSNLIYLDNASTTQKPQLLMEYISHLYSNVNSNVHRGMYPIALKVDQLYKEVHNIIAKHLNANENEIFFVKNATEGLNILALSYEDNITEGDVIVITRAEHHSNYLPWLRLIKRKKTIIEYINLNKDLSLNIESLKELYRKYGSRIKIVSVTHMSNVTGILNDIITITQIAHEYQSIVIVDGTQSIVHNSIDVKDIDCDFFVFSGHKIYGPTGTGVVYGKASHLENFEPVFQGGEMVENVDEDIKYSKIPFKFEAGTPNIVDSIALAKSIDWLNSIKNRFDIENELSQYLYQKILNLDFVECLVETPSTVLSFNIKGIHSHDIAYELGERNICIRAGYHCAQPLHKLLGLKGSARISLGIYNTTEDIDKLVMILKEIKAKYE